jgi:rhodanese-related sulfurtransferase
MCSRDAFVRLVGADGKVLSKTSRAIWYPHGVKRTGDTMETLLIAWCVWAGVILFVCPLINRDPESSRTDSYQPARTHLDYIRISIDFLSEWQLRHSDLLIINLCSDSNNEAVGNSIPGSLNVPFAQLLHLLRWIPPESRLVFYDEGEVHRFSATVEQILLSAGIDGVYILDGGIGSWHAHRSHNITSMRVGLPSAGYLKQEQLDAG